jgi:hypothetical protein
MRIMSPTLALRLPVAALLLATAIAPHGLAQDWKPEKAVELVVGSAAGGPLDATARIVQRHAEVAAEEPFVEQAQFARQQGLVVGGKIGGRCDRLQLQQLGDGGIEQVVGIGIVDHLQERVRAEVFQQQEAAREILRQHLRHAHATGLEQ